MRVGVFVGVSALMWEDNISGFFQYSFEVAINRWPSYYHQHKRPIGYKSVYLPLSKVADTPSHIQGVDMWVTI